MKGAMSLYPDGEYTQYRCADKNKLSSWEACSVPLDIGIVFSQNIRIITNEKGIDQPENAFDDIDFREPLENVRFKIRL